MYAEINSNHQPGLMVPKTNWKGSWFLSRLRNCPHKRSKSLETDISEQETDGDVCSPDGRWTILNWAAFSHHILLMMKLRSCWCPLTCGRSYNVPGGGLRHGIGQSLSEALFTGVCRANVVPGDPKTFRPASANLQQRHATPIKRTCTQTGSLRQTYEQSVVT